FGDTLMRLVVNFAVGSLLVASVVGPMSFRFSNLLPLLAVIALALLLDFCIEGLIGLCAFVTEDVSSIQLIYGKTLFILGGLLIPLDFFPQWLREIAQGLPFHYVIYAPARLFVSFDMGQWIHVAGIQAAWVSVFALALWGLFQRASSHLSINGG
ncbi:MAG: ABC transporter permease, partial [Armatimonadetes bacterium]|nr:ABC transporter permease [Armatimonadota bacterium]